MDILEAIDGLGRKLSYKEQQALRIVMGVVRERLQMLRAERFQLHLEIDKCDREIEALKFREFVEMWHESSETAGGADDN